MNITPNQRKLFWIAGIALAVIYFAPIVMNMVTQAAYIQQVQQASQMPRQSMPVRSASGAAQPNPFHDLLGQYSGNAVLATRGKCNLGLELRQNPKNPSGFSGYSTLTCPTRLLRHGPTTTQADTVQPAVTPISAIATGVVDGDAIRFHVDDTIAADECPASAFTLKPFGVNRAVAQWQDSCGGATIMMTRNGR